MLRRRTLSIALASAGALLATAATPAGAADETMSISATFTVANANRSALACPSDGREYGLHAEVVGPRSVLADPARPASATLYLHEFGFDDFWRFRAVPGYDYAEAMARRGHVTVALDRLGYDDSPRPDGNQTCIGAHADMAHQIVEQLRAGNWSAAGAAPRRFQRVVIAGHSVGAIATQVAAYSFGGVDAMMLFGHDDSGYSQPVTEAGLVQGQHCLTGGDRPSPDDPPNYSFFDRDKETMREIAFYDPDPAVLDAAFRLRHPDPCGDISSFVPAIASNNARAGEIDLPILLAYGRQDRALNPNPGERQSQVYDRAEDVTVAYFERMSHAMTLEPSARQLQDAVAEWLRRRGFASARATRGAESRLRGCPSTARVVAGSDRGERLRGTPGADALFGLRGDDRLEGGDGPDCLRGGDGGDRLLAGAGGDRALGDTGPDLVVGGPGKDRLHGKSGSDRIDAVDGRKDVVSCGSGRDRATVDRADRVVGCERVVRR
jgi:hypothetical protein